MFIEANSLEEYRVYVERYKCNGRYIPEIYNVINGTMSRKSRDCEFFTHISVSFN